MKNIKVTLIIVLLLSIYTVAAQQDPNFIFYRYNMNLINPAYAGADATENEGIVEKGLTNNVYKTNTAELGININSQWTGVSGAPETQSVFFSTGLGEKLGIGVSIINDKTFIENQTTITADISYHISLSLNTKLFFGIKAGGNNYSANLEGLTTFGITSDASLNNISGRFNPNLGAGFYLRSHKYFVAFSIPNLLTSERLRQEDGIARLGESRNHIHLATGYDIPITKKIIFKPSVLATYVDAAPLNLNLTGVFRFSNGFETGLNYALDQGIGGLVLFTGIDWIDIGYGYEASNQNQIQEVANGTHEVFMRFKI